MELHEQQLFDALCDLVIYHYADLCWPSRVGPTKFARSVRLLKRAGIITGRSDPGAVWEKYDAMVEAYALSVMPAGFTAQYDYYGAKIISNNASSSAPKTGLFAGDASGHYMFFASFNAMSQYAEDVGYINALAVR